MRKTLIMGNWKMFGSKVFVTQWIQDFCKIPQSGHCDFVVFPPFPYLDFFQKLCLGNPVKIGAQNCATHDQGAFTGEVSATMLKDLGCHYVLIGHSESRHIYHEKNQDLQCKFSCAQLAGLVPVFCIGETLEERAQGQTLEVLERQIDCILQSPWMSDIVLAYEPVWAIGTGQSASPEQVQEIHFYLRQLLMGVNRDLAERTPIVYGGSVKPENDKNLLNLPDGDGALVGGASLNPVDFISISEKKKRD